VLKLGEASYAVELIGKLTLNGVTRTQNVTSQVTLGAYNLRATGNFQISQSNFEIEPANVAGGLLTLRDELKFAFFMLARQDLAEGFAHATDAGRERSLI
jgi:polyisoprenoid-binding protein YceI